MKVDVRWRGKSGPSGWLATIGVTLAAAAFLVVSLVFFSVFVVAGALVGLGGLLYLLWAKPRHQSREERSIIEGRLADDVANVTHRDPALEHRPQDRAARASRDD